MEYKKLKTVEDCIKKCGHDPKTALPDVSKMPKELADYTLAHVQKTYMVEALNMRDGKKYVPDYRGSEWHYEPFFGIKATDKVPSGVGFSYSSYDSWGSGSNVGARQVFRDKETWEYAIKQFPDLFLRTILMFPPKKKAKSKTNSKAKK